MLRAPLILVATLCSAVLGAQNITHCEYWVDEDPGFGLANAIALPDAADISTALGTLDLSPYSAGIHTVGIRTRDAAGRWGITNFFGVVVDAAPADPLGDVLQVEAFWDEDPGFGQGFALNIGSSATDFQGDLDVPVPATLSPGPHILFTRTLEARGRWSLTNVRTGVVIEPGQAVDDHVRPPSISVFPNPFTEGFTVRTTDGKPLRVVVYDPQGKLVHDQMQNSQTYIDLSGHSNGNYSVILWKDPDRIVKSTVVKQ